MKDKKKFIVIGLTIVVLILLCIGIYSIFSNKQVREDVTIRGVTVYKDLKGEITKYDKTLYVEGYEGNYEKAYYISGKLKSDVDYDTLIVSFDIKDRKGNVLGSAIAGLTEIKKDGEYTFKALSTVKESDLNKIYNFEVSDIRGE